MSTVDREVKRRMDDAAAAVLKNRDKEQHPALQARYEAFRVIDEFLTEQRLADNQGEEPTDDKS